MIKTILTLILGIYLGAFLGIDRINKVTVFCVEGVKTVYKTMQGESNEQK